ncbi:hypothetical protein HBO32_07760 [Pseudomonas nitroreducens]|uniref:hypothetical protein n=1 Tax=Pseudomonas TaxID=286 RepID=UPI0007EE69E6|nr:MULTISPECIES: hypothetical protein [Pseudomonas]NMZ72991.1 hypothetical protein [Pseudomonas nitroreducens]OBY59901.1 hypothetical protein A9513_020220 [Pseudomonas sp. AU12215]
MYHTQHDQDRSRAKSYWEAALSDPTAFLYYADEHYHYLLAQANEIYQQGLISLAERKDMLTRSLNKYSWAVEHNIRRESHWCRGCYYHVLAKGEVVGEVGPEGHYLGLDRKLLGNIEDDKSPKLYAWVNQFDREVAGVVEGLKIICDGQELFQLREFVPKGAGDRRWPYSGD